MTVHHHSKTHDILLGCNHDVKQMSSKGGDILSITNQHWARVGEHEDEILISTEQDGAIRILKYDPSSSQVGRPKELFNFPAKSTLAYHISVSSGYIAAVDREHKTLQLFNRATNSLAMKALLGHIKPHNLHFLPDGCLLVTVEGNKVIKYRILESGELEEIWTCEGLEHSFGIANDRKGLIYVSSSRDKNIFLVNEGGG